MLKWILGGIAALALLLAGTCWYGYKRLTAGGDTARVAILTSPDRVWSHLIVLDSLRAWQDSSTTLTSTGDSVLEVGDTVRMESRVGSGVRTGNQRMLWVVSRVDSPRVVVWAARDDSTGMEVFQRIDSIGIAGDSVILSSRFASPVVDSLRQADSGGLGQRILGGVGNMMSSAFRAMAERDLARLKARLEVP
jgi:hypothetical protein